MPLYRTREPRIIAGVCGGLARATNTDPILFRVILAVLVFFGGIGALLYLLGWLLLPLEGESASPAEALLGRGRSSTSPLVTVLLGILAVIGLTTSLNTGFENVVLLIAVLVGVALLLRRSGPDRVPTATPAAGYDVAYAGPQPYTPQPYTPQQPFSAPPVPPHPGATGGPATFPATSPASPAMATATTATLPVSPPAPAGPYSSPFAPHGPYVPPKPPKPPIPPIPPAPPRRPKAPRERSALGRITFAVLCLALAIVTIVDLSGQSVPFTAYVATALSVTALGLLVGAWFGRSRLLIVLGIVLSVMLGIGAASERIGDYTSFDESVLWRPTSFAELQSEYRHDSGNVTLDLTALNFADRPQTNVQVRLGAGDLVILVPPNVDVDADVNVGAGEAQIFDGHSDGLGIDRTVTNNGLDGPGGGNLDLDVEVGVGSLGVHR